MTTFRETLTGVGLLAVGTTLVALVVLQGILAHPPVAVPVALLAIGAGIATLDVPRPAGTPDTVGHGKRPA